MEGVSSPGRPRTKPAGGPVVAVRAKVRAPAHQSRCSAKALVVQCRLWAYIVSDTMTCSHACQGMLGQRICYYVVVMCCHNDTFIYIYTTPGVMQICARTSDANEKRSPLPPLARANLGWKIPLPLGSIAADGHAHQAAGLSSRGAAAQHRDPSMSDALQSMRSLTYLPVFVRMYWVARLPGPAGCLLIADWEGRKAVKHCVHTLQGVSPCCI